MQLSVTCKHYSSGLRLLDTAACWVGYFLWLAMATAMTLTENVFFLEKEKFQVRKCSIAKFDFMPSREIINCEYFSWELHNCEKFKRECVLSQKFQWRNRTKVGKMSPLLIPILVTWFFLFLRYLGMQQWIKISIWECCYIKKNIQELKFAFIWY